MVADSSFPDCCIDIISASHKNNVIIVKVGYICSSYVNIDDDTIVLPVLYDVCRLFPELEKLVEEKFSSNNFKWAGVADKCKIFQDKYKNLLLKY